MPSLMAHDSKGVDANQPVVDDRPLPKYFLAVALPPQLREYCKIYLEEKLYSQSISLLSSVLTAPLSLTTSGLATQSLSTASTASSYVPSASIIGLLGTLSIHPSLTSPHASSERLASANAGLHYLHALNSVVGPVNAQLNQAFRFKEQRRGGGRGSSGYARGNTRQSNSEDDDMSHTSVTEEVEDMRNELAGSKSVWTQAQDFWHILGWSFNCAARFPPRWARWKLWLELVVTILEDDWAERSRIVGAREDGEEVEAEANTQLLEQSLLVHFVGGDGEVAPRQGQAALRRVMRALFADGHDAEMNEFGEVWRGETKERVKREQDGHDTAQLKKVNVEEGQFGDYFDNESSDEDGSGDVSMGGIGVKQEDERAGSTSKRRSKTKRGLSTSAPTTPTPGHHAACVDSRNETLPLRRRLIALLIKLSSSLPSHFTDHDALIDVLEDYMRPLPIPHLVALTSYHPTQNLLPPASHISLLQDMARPLLAGSGSLSNTIRSYYLTQAVLESAYLPFAAAGDAATTSTSTQSGPTPAAHLGVLVANAKLSICLENMTRLMHAHVGLTAGDEGKSLRRAVEKGIKARQMRVRGKYATGGGEEGAEARRWLESSAGRLRVLVRLVERG